MPELEITQQKNGFWLWDNTRKMNLSMRAPTREAAMLEAIVYYQNRLMEVEKELREITGHVNTFVESVRPDDEGEWYEKD